MKLSDIYRPFGYKSLYDLYILIDEYSDDLNILIKILTQFAHLIRRDISPAVRNKYKACKIRLYLIDSQDILFPS